jgi:tetratricopeptide (TPR) repeat protein
VRIKMADKVEIFFVIDTADSKLMYIGARAKTSADKPREWRVVDVVNEIYSSPHLPGRKSKPEGLFPLFAWVGLGLPPIAKTEAKDEINRIVRNSLSCRNRWIRREKKYCEGKKSPLYHKMRCFHLQHRFLFETFRRVHSIKLSKTSSLEASDIHIYDLDAMRKHIRVKDDKAFANRLSTIDPDKLEACLLDQRSLYRAMADFAGVSEIKTREISSALEPLRKMGKRFTAKLADIQSEYIAHLSSEDPDGLYDHLCRSPFSEGMPLTEVAHPRTENITLTPGLRLRIVGRPGSGKSVSLYQICRRSPGWQVLIMKPTIPLTELEAITSFCKSKRSEPIALIFEDLQRHLATDGAGLLLHTLTMIDAHRRDAAVIVTYRGTEVLEVNRHIGPEEWYVRGFRNNVWLDPAPKGFIRQVLRLSAKVFGVQITEQLFDKWVEWVEKSDNTPLYCAEIAHSWHEMVVTEQFFRQPPPRSSVERWKRLFEDLVNKPDIVCSLGPHVLQVLAFLHLLGELSPFELEEVFSFFTFLADNVSRLTFSECIDALHRCGWLLKQGTSVYIHDVQLDPSVVGLSENRKATQAFHRCAEAAIRFVSRIPPNKAATLLCRLERLWTEHGESKKADEMVDAALRLVPRHEKALALRGLSRIARSRLRDGMADILAATKGRPNKRLFSAALLLMANRPLGRQVDLVIELFRPYLPLNDWIDLALMGYLCTGCFDRAVALATEYAEQKPDCAQPPLILSKTLLQSGMPEDALAIVEGVLKLDPDNETAWLIRGMAFLWLQNHSEAQRTFEQASSRFPTSLEIQMSSAEAELWIACLTSGEARFKAARRALHSATWCANIMPSDSVVLTLKGLALLALGSLSEAEETLREGLKIGVFYELGLRFRMAATRAIFRLTGEADSTGICTCHAPTLRLSPKDVLFYCRLFRNKTTTPNWVEVWAFLSLGRVEAAGNTLKRLFELQLSSNRYSDPGEAMENLTDVMHQFIFPVESLVQDSNIEAVSTPRAHNNERPELGAKLCLQSRLNWANCDLDLPENPCLPSDSKGDHAFNPTDEMAITCIAMAAEEANIGLAGELHQLWAGWLWKQGRRLPLQARLPFHVLARMAERRYPVQQSWFTLAVSSIALAYRVGDGLCERLLRHLLKFRWHKVCRAAECDDAIAASLAALVDHVAKVWGKKSPVPPELAIRGRALLNSCSDSGPLGVCVLSDLWRRSNNEMPSEPAPN